MSSDSPLPLVLLPGFMLDESLWDDMIPCLRQNAPLYRPGLSLGTTIEAIAKGIAKTAPDRFVLVGFSLGGFVARKVAELYPNRVAALILIATSLRVDSHEQAKSKVTAVASLSGASFGGLSAHSIAKSLHPDLQSDKAVVKRIKAMGARLGYEALVTQTNLRRDQIAAASLTCPTLIIAANQDSLRSRAEAKELAETIPNATLKFIDRSGHMLPLEQPRALANEIENWLELLQR